MDSGSAAENLQEELQVQARKTVIKVAHLSKSFLTSEVETRALSDLSFSVEAGEFVAIEGPSGCGKSTLLSILGLLDAPSAGTYELAGVNVADVGYSERLRVRNQHIGIVFQAFNLITTLNALDNVALPLSFRRGVTRADALDRAKSALESVGMGHRLKHCPDQLSGGQQQRVAIARALVGKPDILLADEPTGNLDSENAQAIVSLFEDMHARGQTILMVTHDAALAARANRRLRLLDGKLGNTQ